MHARLRDLRLLYLAHEVEESFEGLEKALGAHLPAHLSEALRPLFEGGPAHRRLEQALADLNARVGRETAAISPLDILEALLDLERTAQDFYHRHAGELSDPALQALFMELAQEEGRHALAVGKAILAAGGTGGVQG